MRRTFRGAVALLGATAAVGCASVPELEQDGVSISEIVQRVKCELAFAMPDPQPPYPTGRYQWMRDWTAKVDLTLITNNQASLTPSIAVLHQMPPAVLTGIGTFGQMFGASGGGGVATTAIRNESLSFTVAIKELRAERNRLACDLPNAPDLYGRLGLQEWIASALAPVANSQLRIGHHPPPNGKSLPAPPVAVAAAETQKQILQQKKALVEFWAGVVKEHAKAVDDHAKAVNSGADLKDIQIAYDEAFIVNRATAKAAAEYGKAAVAYKNAKATDPKDLELDRLLQAAKDANDEAAKAKQDVASAIEGLPHDPPIDSIGHQVQFVVMSSANIAPNWSLVSFKGPANAGPLAAASRTNTHTLIIALGAPAVPGSVKPSEEQIRQLNNQHLDALRAPLGQ
ncbi:hypothetical protein FBZ93_11176 [Bradyrhizobium macuxiense]|uniref:Lipoprotein n=1 Tax=Bradyrhizobium macuxiense TaxID=1755647 RepID=A0A560LCK4_9BRAD|nr:hypothetical protein [Bradyrhizobium macuxiense]TWB93037.1 hypothetical protein FBZ93_11176 [Bradyrhizobium macuxiense]